MKIIYFFTLFFLVTFSHASVNDEEDSSIPKNIISIRKLSSNNDMNNPSFPTKLLDQNSGSYLLDLLPDEIITHICLAIMENSGISDAVYFGQTCKRLQTIYKDSKSNAKHLLVDQALFITQEHSMLSKSKVQSLILSGIISENFVNEENYKTISQPITEILKSKNLVYLDLSRNNFNILFATHFFYDFRRTNLPVNIKEINLSHNLLFFTNDSCLNNYFLANIIPRSYRNVYFNSIDQDTIRAVMLDHVITFLQCNSGLTLNFKETRLSEFITEFNRGDFTIYPETVNNLLNRFNVLFNGKRISC